jgi:hypothetical protein
MSKQARRAAFYHQQRRRRATLRQYRGDPSFIGEVTDFQLNGKRVGTGRGLLFRGARTGREELPPQPQFQPLPPSTPEARRMIEAWRAENPEIVDAWKALGPAVAPARPGELDAECDAAVTGPSIQALVNVGKLP